MPRRPGPPPNPNHIHRNVDPVIGGDGWTEIANEPFAGDVPAVPEWLVLNDDGKAIYAELAKLPQAAAWGPGTWFEFQLALPLIEKYLARPGSEGLKAIVSTLGSALRLTEDDMQRARMRFIKENQSADGDVELPSEVADISDRRKRLTG